MFADTNLFPLPLQGFEELFVHDDNGPDYPAVFSTHFEFDGRIDPSLAEQALQDLIKQQPMLNVRLDRSSNGAMQWRLEEDRSADASHVSQDEADRLRPIDLFTERPFRLDVSRQKNSDGNERSSVTFQFHHAAFDGVGALTVVSDWMKSYDRLSHNSSCAKGAPRQNRLDYGMLRARCRAGLTWRERLRLAPWSWLSIIGFVNFFKNRPIPLLPLGRIGSVTAVPSGQPIISTQIVRESTESLKARASELGVTVNDLIAVELFTSIKRWQSRQEIVSEGSHFRITIPINERTLRHRRMPGCLHCTMISLDRRPGQISIDSANEPFKNLVQQVHHEIETVRDWRLSLTFWSTLHLFRRLGGIKHWFATNKCRSTCVLTNLGQLSQRLRLPTNEQGQMMVAGIPLIDAELAAPVRYGTAAAFSVFIYQRRLNIAMNYDRTSLTREAANDLLNILKQQLSSE